MPGITGKRGRTGRPGRPFPFRALGVAALALVSLGAPRPGRAQAPTGDLRTLLATTPADSLPPLLRRFEAAHARAPEGAEAALALGQLHYARGEYRRAADTFARAAARLEPARKPEARYWAGLSWLALGEPNQARAALDEAAVGARRGEAMLAQGHVWEVARRPERAREAFEGTLTVGASEAGPGALERIATLAQHDGHDDQARDARERLLREYPRSMEAAAARRAVFSPVPRGTGSARAGATAVVIGSFVDPARARALAAAARAAGFPDARVVSRGSGLSAVHQVRLGVYPRVIDARQAGVQAEQALGVTFELARGH